MGTIVIVPPAPLLVPGDISGPHAANDPAMMALIAAATEEIDGPEGWLGRALGPQTLETSAPGFSWRSWRLPYPPLIEVLSVTYRDRQGVVTAVSSDVYEWRDNQLWLKPGKAWPTATLCSDAVRIRYKAGYNSEPVESGGTGSVPERVRQAIILAVRHAMSVGAENLFLRSEEVEGIGTQTFTVSTVAGDLIRGATDRLLQGLRIYT